MYEGLVLMVILAGCVAGAATEEGVASPFERDGELSSVAEHRGTVHGDNPTAAGQGAENRSDPSDRNPGASTARFGAESSADWPFLFASDRTGVFQIYLQLGDKARPLTGDEDHDSWWPRLSPDGSMIMISRSPVGARPAIGSIDGNYRSASLWTMRLDGSGLEERIPATTFAQLGPADWSPDGRQVVFAATDPDDRRFRIWVADTERFTARPVTGDAGLFLDPSFGPDGRMLTFVGYPAGYRGPDDGFENLEVFVANADGSGRVRLTFDDLQDHSPAWSPDGRSIVFETAVDPNYLLVGIWDLRSVPADGGIVSTVLSDGNVNTAGRWHRSEAGLFFQRFVFGGDGRRLAYLNSDGSGLTMLGEADAGYDDINIDPIPASFGWP